MIGAAAILFVAVLMGALLNCLVPPKPRYVRLTAGGHEVELVPPEQFRITCDFPRRWPRLSVHKLPCGARVVTSHPELENPWRWVAAEMDMTILSLVAYGAFRR